MKVLDRFNLALFSAIVLILSLLVCLLSFGWLRIELAIQSIEFLVEDNLANNIAIGVSILLILLAVKSIFFNSYTKEKAEGKEGILLENENGKLLVSRDTIESLTNTVVKSFESVQNSTTRVSVDEESKISIFITLFVNADAIIKELSNKLQNDVKETVKRSIGLEVTEVNIRIKNIATKKEPNIKE